MDDLGSAGISVEADLTGFAAGLRAKAEKAIAKAEAKISDLDIDVDIDDAKVLTGVRKVRAEVALLFDQMGKINLDDADADADVLATRMLRVNVIAASIDDKYAGINKKIADTMRSTKSMLDFEKQWRRETESINGETDRLLKSVSKDLVKSWRSVSNTMGEAKQTILEMGKNIRVVRTEGTKLDGTAKSILKSFQGLARASGGGGGGRKGGFLSKSTFSDPQASMASLGARALALAGLFGPLGGTVSGLAASLVAVTGAIGLASGAMVTGASVVSALGGAFIALKVGMSGVGDALNGVEGSMKKLTPSAQEFVKAVKAAKPEWDAFKKSLQEKLFAGLGAEVNNFATNLLPKLTPAFSGIAAELNKAAKAMSQWATSNEGVKTLTGIFGGMRDILKTLLPALGNIGKGLLTLWSGSMPQAKAMSGTLLELTKRFSVWTKQLTAGGATSKFSKFLKDASGAASALLGVLGSMGGLLRRVFGAGADEGVGLLKTFEKLIDKANTFFDTAEGQRALEGFFGTIEVAAKTFGNAIDALGPVVRALGDAFSAMRKPMEGLRKQLQPILQLVGQKLAASIKAVTPLLTAIAQILTGIAAGFNLLPGPVKGFLVQIGLALIIIPKLTAAFAAAKVSMVSSAATFGIWGKSAKAAAASAAAAGTSVSRFGKLSKIAAGAAGIAAITAASGTSNKALSTLGDTAGFAAAGFAVGGPWGAAIGGGIGLLKGLTGGFGSTSRAAKEQAEAINKINYDTMLNQIAELRGSLNQTTGALTKSTKAMVDSWLHTVGEGREVFDTLTGLNVNQRTIMASILGDPEANAKVASAISGRLAGINAAIVAEETKTANTLAALNKANSLTKLQDIAVTQAASDKKIAGLKAEAQAITDGTSKLAPYIDTVKRAAKEQRNFYLSTTPIPQILKVTREEYRSVFAKKVRGVLRIDGVPQTLGQIKKVAISAGGLSRKAFTLLLKAAGIEQTKKQLDNLVKVGKGKGDDTGKVFAKGVEGEIERGASQWKARLKAGVTSTGVSTKPTAKKAGSSVGAQLVSGVIGGLNSQSSALYATANGIIRRTIDGMNAEAQIASPSKVTKLMGKFLAMGLAKGIAGDRSAVDAAQKLMGTLTTRLGKAGEKAAAKVVQAYRKGLLKAAASIDRINEKIADAVSGLKAAREAFREFAQEVSQGIVESFGLTAIDLTDILPANQFATIIDQFTAAAKAAAAWEQVLKDLSRLGLNNDLLGMFVATGPAALAEAQAILGAGAAGIAQINEQFKDIGASAFGTGSWSAGMFKQGAIDAAATFVQTLRLKKKDIVADFRDVARNFVVAIIKNIKDLGLDKLLSGTLPKNKHASGTVSSPGGLSLVGERGPELMQLPRGTRVWNNGDTNRMMSGGGDITVNMNVSVDDLAKMTSIAQFMDMLQGARVQARKTQRSGAVSA